MTNSEIIQEVKNIKVDFLEKKLTLKECIQGLKKLSKVTKKDFSSLYNAFYSSKPELYIN